MKDIIVFGRGVYWQCKKKSMIRDFNIVAFIDSHVRENDNVMEENITYGGKRI